MKRNFQDAATGREGPTDDWIVLAVHPVAVVRDALGRVAGEWALLASARRPVLPVTVRTQSVHLPQLRFPRRTQTA